MVHLLEMRRRLGQITVWGLDRIEPIPRIHKKTETGKLREKNYTVLYIELLYSILTLISAYTVVFQFYPVFGVFLGAFMQIAWIHLWTVTGQIGIILLDMGLLGIYAMRIINIMQRRKIEE